MPFRNTLRILSWFKLIPALLTRGRWNKAFWFFTLSLSHVWSQAKDIITEISFHVSWRFIKRYHNTELSINGPSNSEVLWSDPNNLTKRKWLKISSQYRFKVRVGVWVGVLRSSVIRTNYTNFLGKLQCSIEYWFSWLQLHNCTHSQGTAYIAELIRRRSIRSDIGPQWCVSLTPNNTKTIERMTFHCFLRPIRRDLTNSSYATPDT